MPAAGYFQHGNAGGQNSPAGNGVGPGQPPGPARIGPMTDRYIYDTTGVPDRVSGYQGYPPTERQRGAEMSKEAQRLADIVRGPR